MPTIEQQIDPIMERASAALAARDYLACESACLEALGMARDASAWAIYARVLLPLQEARRQRRMIAADGSIRLGCERTEGELASSLQSHAPACLCVTPPFRVEDAAALRHAARSRYLEILFAEPVASEVDHDAGAAERWRVHAPSLTALAVDVEPPSPKLREIWWPPADSEESPCPDATDMTAEKKIPGSCIDPANDRQRAADWFLDAGEALGDEALRRWAGRADQGPEALAELEQLVEQVPDHELLHQRLASVARELARRDPRGSTSSGASSGP